MNTMNVHQSNLLQALHIAIQNREAIEKAAGYNFDTIYTSGLKQLLKHIQEGGQIYIIPAE